MAVNVSKKEAERLQANLKGGLFVGKKPRPLVVRTSARSPMQDESESVHAQKMIGWLNTWSRWFPELGRTFHVANENKNQRVYGSGLRRQAEGVRPGVFDYYNLASRRDYSGLAVELKRKDNKLTSEPEKQWDQVRERAWLTKEGKAVHVCWSWAEAAAVHVWYFQIFRFDIVQSFLPFEPWLTSKGGHDRRCGCELNLAQYFAPAAKRR